jgi:CBS-domain-containing membrane protein
MKRYIVKFRTREQVPGSPPPSHILYSALGALIAISAVTLLTQTTDIPFMMAPFGATCVLAFGVIDSPLAQPRNIIGGHLIAAIIAVMCVYLMGNTWYSLAIGVSASIAAMQITKTVHPPAGATPLVIIFAQPHWTFIFYPVLTGSLVIVIIALLFNNIFRTRRYPRYWR